MTQSFPVCDQPVLQNGLTFSLVWSALPFFPLHVSSLFLFSLFLVLYTFAFYDAQEPQNIMT